MMMGCWRSRLLSVSHQYRRYGEGIDKKEQSKIKSWLQSGVRTARQRNVGTLGSTPPLILYYYDHMFSHPRSPEYLGVCLIRFRIKFGVVCQGVIQNWIKNTEFCKNLSSGFRIKLEGHQGYDLGPDIKIYLKHGLNTHCRIIYKQLFRYTMTLCYRYFTM